MPDKYSDEEIKEMWPQARGELLGFARALNRNSNITASQLMMAIQLADEAFSNYCIRKTIKKINEGYAVGE